MDEGSKYLEEYEPEVSLKLEDYEEYIGKKKVEELKKYAGPLEGKRWTHVNSTFMGGGVSEMLRSVIPLARSLGIHAEWMAIKGHDAFFSVTKKFHNMLQGRNHYITLEEIFEAYLDNIDKNAKNTFIASDLVVIHDPQPAAIIMNGVIFGNILWRCHIDTSSPNKIIWRFLLPYINQCSGAIFTMPQFVGPGVQVPTYQIMPCIDPRSPKNHQYSREEALEVLAPLFHEHNIDPDRPILAAISRYDIHKNQGTVLKAFQEIKKSNHFNPPPYLIFLGNTATDDPEGGKMLETLQEQAQNDPDIRFWVNVEDNDRVVGALAAIARAFVHISTREGFGLVVTEALWQGTPVIGSLTGGIPSQIVDGKTGLLSEPMDVDKVQANMATLLEKPDLAEGMGKEGKEFVREHFLLPELIRRYLVLLRIYSGIDRKIPSFRLNELSYTEIMQAIRVRHPYLGGQ